MSYEWQVILAWTIMVLPWFQVAMTYTDMKEYDWQPPFSEWLLENKEHIIAPAIGTVFAICSIMF